MTEARFPEVSQADNRGDGLSAGDLNTLSAVVADSFRRLDVIHRITSNASRLVSDTARAIAQDTDLSGTHRRLADCLRDLDIILRQISVATAAGSRGQLLSSGELTAVVGRFERAASALAAAKVLTANADQLVTGATQAVCTLFPYPTQPREISAPSDAQGREACARDIRTYLGWITRSLLSSSSTPLEEGLIDGLDAINRAVELSPSRSVVALTHIKANHGLQGETGVIADIYMDYAIHSLV